MPLAETADGRRGPICEALISRGPLDDLAPAAPTTSIVSFLRVPSFSDPIAETQPLFSDARHADYLTHTDRLEEATTRVEECVGRAVHGELDTTGYRALGRLTKFSPPGLAEYLAGKGRFALGDQTAAGAIAESACEVMALGWLFCCTPQTQVLDRSARDVWDFWAGPSLRDSLDQIVPKDLASRPRSWHRPVGGEAQRGGTQAPRPQLLSRGRSAFRSSSMASICE